MATKDGRLDIEKNLQKNLLVVVNDGESEI